MAVFHSPLGDASGVKLLRIVIFTGIDGAAVVVQSASGPATWQ